jgi:hypothetical protein
MILEAIAAGMERRAMKYSLLSLILVTGLGLAQFSHAQDNTAPPLLAPAPAAAAQDSAHDANTLPDLSPTPNQRREGMEMPEMPDSSSVIKPADPAWHQPEEKPTRQHSAEKIFNQLPPEVQKQILDESHKVNQECKGYELYAQLHDCDCMGTRYFEERVFNPEIYPETLKHKLASECTNDAGVAGYANDQCMDTMVITIRPDKLEEYCKCYALQMAERYKNNPSADYGYLRALGSGSHTYCMKSLKTPIIKRN